MGEHRGIVRAGERFEHVSESLAFLCVVAACVYRGNLQGRLRKSPNFAGKQREGPSEVFGRLFVVLLDHSETSLAHCMISSFGMIPLCRRFWL